MKKVSIIGVVGIPACYGGFESLVENLTIDSGDGIEYTVFCSSKNYSTKLDEHNNAKLVYLNLKANGIQSVFYDIISLIKSIFMRPDVVLILGVSGCLFLPVFKLLSKSKIITNIDGLEWKRDKWSSATKGFLKLSEKVAVKFSDVIITDNQAISDYVLSEYGVESETIAYGGDHALREVEVDNYKDKYALGLCRIEPENNVEMILDSFSKSNIKLKFIGNWNASEYGIKLKDYYKKYSNIEIIDPIYDLDELFKFRCGCSFYIHGHSAGGTNPSLVEMMHFSVPIIAYDCTFNRHSTEDKALYFSNSDDLRKKLNSISEEELFENGLSMKQLANAKYKWDLIRDKYEICYHD